MAYNREQEMRSRYASIRLLLEDGKQHIERNCSIMTDIRKQSLTITLVVNGQPYECEVEPQEIYHEALEHALPVGLLVGHRIRISTPAGEEVFPDMFIGESVSHFRTRTFHIEAIP